MYATDDQRAADRRVHDWNLANPQGTPVRAWPGTRDQEPLLTRTRSSAWVLPSAQPVVFVVGHAGGIHLDHVDVDPTRQPAVPDITFERPPCPLCGTDLQVDGDAFVCHPCAASWNLGGMDGAWLDPEAIRCPATSRPIGTTLDEQCVLALGHASESHRPIDGISDWTDNSPTAVLDSEGDPIR